jgi:hypothetical protein
MIPPGSAVFLQSRPQYRGPLAGIARRLKVEFGARIHLFVGNDQDLAHYRHRDAEGLYDEVTVGEVLYRAARETPPETDRVVADARANERWLDATYNELALTDRHLGRGFSLAGHGHPRSKMSEETDWLRMLHGINCQIAFWRSAYEHRKPALFINPTKIACAVARRMGIQIRVLAGSRYRNYHYWAVNEFFESPSVGAAYQRVASAPDALIDAPYATHLQVRSRLKQAVSLSSALQRMGRFALQRAYWTLRGYEKASGYRFRDGFRLPYRVWRDYRRLVQTPTVPLAALADKPFVYYPLHAEPEAAVHQLSPEFFFQLESIAALARDLPAGIPLAVKETFFAIGRRPRDFYAQLAEFKNVVLLNVEELGLEVVRRAAAVATITGTGGFEAAVLGKPVISFGRHNLYNFLPHVRAVRDIGSLKPMLNEFLTNGFDHGRARADGARFLAAVLAVSFDMAGFDIYKPDVCDDAVIENGYRLLLQGLA